MAPEFTPGLPVDRAYRALELGLATDSGLPRRRVVFAQATGEARESKVRRLVLRLR